MNKIEKIIKDIADELYGAERFGTDIQVNQDLISHRAALAAMQKLIDNIQPVLSQAELYAMSTKKALEYETHYVNVDYERGYMDGAIFAMQYEPKQSENNILAPFGIKISEDGYFHYQDKTYALTEISLEQIKALKENKEVVFQSTLTQQLLTRNTSQETPELVWASIVDGLEKKEDRDKYPNSIFWFKNGNCYFEYNEKNKYFWCLHSLVWSVFESQFNWKDRQIKNFIQSKVEEHFKLKGVTALEDGRIGTFTVEEHFKEREESNDLPKVTPESIWMEITNGIQQSICNTKHSPNSIFWFKNGNFYFEYDRELNTFLCSPLFVWGIFERYRLGYSEIARLIKTLASKEFKLPNIITVSYAGTHTLARAKQVYNLNQKKHAVDTEGRPTTK